MFQFSRPVLRANPKEGFYLVIPAYTEKFILKFDEFISSENNIFVCFPEKRKCKINENFQIAETGPEVYIVTFPDTPEVLAESVLKYMMTN